MLNKFYAFIFALSAIFIISCNQNSEVKGDNPKENKVTKEKVANTKNEKVDNSHKWAIKTDPDGTITKVLREADDGSFIRPDGFEAANGPIIQSNYFDLAMLMDYWSESRLNHHTEATSMLYAARESARLVMQEGLDARFARHTRTSRAITAGFRAMGLEVFGDQRYKMPNVTGVVIPESVTGEAVRMDMLEQFGIEIGTSFGPLHGKIWRIGTMGYGCRKDNVLACLGALEACLRRHGFSAPAGAGVEAAWRSYDDADNSI